MLPSEHDESHTTKTNMNAQRVDLGDCMLTTEHAASCYGVPVLVGADGAAYGAADTVPFGHADARTHVACASMLRGVRQHPLVIQFLRQAADPDNAQ